MSASSEQIRRITKAEEQLDKASSVLKELEAALEKYIAARGDIDRLIEYYESPEWLRDFDDSNSGKLPRGLKCGVLSEDAVYDMLSDDKRLAELMRDISRVVLEKMNSED